MRGASPLLRRPFSRLSDVAGGGVAIGDITAFSENPGAEYVLADGRILRQADYPDLVGKLPAVGQSLNISRSGFAVSGSGVESGASYRKFARGFGKVLVYPGFDVNGTPAYSTDDGINFSADNFFGNRLGTSQPLGAAYILDDDKTLLIYSNGNNYTYFRTASRSNGTLVDNPNIPSYLGGSGFRGGAIAFNPKTSNFVIAFESFIYVTKDPVAGAVQFISSEGVLQSPRYIIFDENGLGVMLGRTGRVLVTNNDFINYTKVEIDAGSSNFASCLSYSVGTWMVALSNGDIFRTRTPLIASSWVKVLAANRALAGVFGEGKIWQAHCLGNGNPSTYFQSIDDGLTWSSIVDNLYMASPIVGRLAGSWFKFAGDGNTTLYSQRFQPYAGIITATAQQTRPDGKINYLRAK